MKLNNSQYAAFIMTYRRPDILKQTIDKLIEQRLPPHKILIIDNDPLKSASSVIENYSSDFIEYFSTGYNSGPAGAAKFGLENLSSKGFSWIAWIDDDNPPVFDDIFKRLIELGNSHNRVGCVGTVGQYFNQKKGIMERVSDIELDGSGFIQVDNIAGGMCKLINTNVVIEDKILPDEKLFYGFEELDFDIRLKNAGYILLTDKEIYKKHRILYNRMSFTLHRGSKKEISNLWREYYSIRNILFILKKQKFYKAIILTIARSILKLFFGFRYGIVYGFKNAKLISLALWHFIIDKTGKLNGIHE